MRERLRQYIERLFMNAPRTQSAQELKEEMLQNLYDKYDDLIAEGKSEEDAYEAAIAGIGDVSGLIAGLGTPYAPASSAPVQPMKPTPRQKNPVVLAAAIVLYVLSIVPNIAFGGLTGVVMMFSMIAVATGMLIINRTVVHPARAALVGVGVALCILCPVPTMLVGNVLGVVLLFVMVAAGVGLIVYGRSSRFEAAPAAENGTQDGGEGGLARESRLGYIALAAIALLFILCAILSDGRSRRQMEWHGLVGEIVTDEDAFEQRIEDAIEGKIEGRIEEGLGIDRDDDDKMDKDKKGSGKQGAAATAEIMDGATEIPAAGIADIDIEWVGGNVQIAPYGGDTIAISETSATPLTNAQKLRYAVRGNKLYISYCEETYHIWDWLDIDRLRMPAKDLTVQLPAGALKELGIQAVSANVTISGVAFDELDVESVSGNVTVTDVSGRKLSVQSTSGKADISGADLTKLDIESASGVYNVTKTRADDVDVETISANIKLELTDTPSKFESEAVSGDVTLILPAGATDFTVRTESVSGNFDCDIALVNQNGRYMAGNGAAQYEFSSVSGDFAIRVQ